MPTPDINTFYIDSDDPGVTFHADFGDGAPLVIDGYGGWQVTSRPRDLGVTEWNGRNPMAIEIPFVINFFEEGDGLGCEQEVRNLERLCGLGGHGQPPVCEVNGHGVIPHDEHNAPDQHKWVVENVQWDRNLEVRSGNSQRRLQCGGTLTVRQFIEASPLEQIGASDRASQKKKKKKKNKKGKSKKHQTVFITHSKMTLPRVAAEVWGDSRDWHIIGDANGRRDPLAELPIGTRLRIPT